MLCDAEVVAEAGKRASSKVVDGHGASVGRRTPEEVTPACASQSQHPSKLCLESKGWAFHEVLGFLPSICNVTCSDVTQKSPYRYDSGSPFP